MLLITPFALIFKLWLANLERVMIEFAHVMNEMVNDEKREIMMILHNAQLTVFPTKTLILNRDGDIC